MKRKIVSLLTILMACIGVFAFTVACDKTPDEGTQNGDPTDVVGEEAGEYYCDVDGAEGYFSLAAGHVFTLKLNGEEKTGSYRLDGEALTLTFGEGGQASAIYKSGVVTLNYGGSEYQFLRDVDYTVSFKTNGGTSVPAATVRNGKQVTKPTDPVKAGEVFVGWYMDGEYRREFHFSQPITANTVLYGRFVKPLEPEFDVKFDLGQDYKGEPAELPATRTIGHFVFDLPEPEWAGHTFEGWWVSHFESPEKLTYRYDGQALSEDVTLFAVWDADGAPLVSVSEEGVSWTAEGSNNRYSVKITPPDGGTPFIQSTNALSLEYDFTAQKEGEYQIDVTSNDKTSTVYYNNKALARVSDFYVEGDKLFFNQIENAEYYLLTVKCGTAAHDHSREPVRIEAGEGASAVDTVFDFSSCEMPQGGILFIVEAYAEGYVSSHAEYTFTRGLDEVKNLKVNSAEELVTWDAVAHALSYDIEVLCGDETVYSENVFDRAFSLKELDAGEYTITVVPVARGWSAAGKAVYNYRKTRLASPSGLRIEGSTITWEPVKDAQGYEVTVGGKTEQTEGTELLFSEQFYTQGQKSYTVTVIALGATSETNSLPSDSITVQYGEFGGTISYWQGVVSWPAVIGVTNFLVKVNEDGESFAVEGKNSAPVSFTQEGRNTIYVCAVNADGSQSEWLTTDVDVVKIVLYDEKGIDELNCVYRANGDRLELPAADNRIGYTFVAWFDSTNGWDGEGKPFTDTYFIADDSIIGYIFPLYAGWAANPHRITLKTDDFADLDVESVLVEFGKNYTLKPPRSKNPEKAFYGWYAEPGGISIQYTDYHGDSLTEYSYDNDITVYAAWADVFSFEKAETGWAVSKGPGVDYVTEITVPTMHVNPATGLEEPVTEVNSFTDCVNLTVINIPDTIRTITLGTGGAAFTGCNNLRAVNILRVEGRHQRLYSSDRGVVIYDNPLDGVRELVYYPKAKSGSYTVPNGVQRIAPQAIDGAAINELYIPTSVTVIAAEGISNCSELTTVEFVTTTRSAGEPLSLSESAFANLPLLTKLVIPTNLADFIYNMIVSCGALENIGTIAAGGSYYEAEGALAKNNGSEKELVYLPKGKTGVYTVPSGITRIGDHAAYQNTKLTGLVIPAAVTEIASVAFGDCTGLTSIEFEGTASDFDLTIEAKAFLSTSNRKLPKIETLTLPANLVSVGANAFGGGAYTTVVLDCGANYSDGRPRTVEFANNAFVSESNVSSVENVQLNEFVPSLDVAAVFGTSLQSVEVAGGNSNLTSQGGVLFDKQMTEILYYPKGKAGSYEIPDSVVRIGANVFEERTALTQITIPAGVTEIDEAAFKGCTSLTTVIFKTGENAPLTIGAKAFMDCNELSQISLPTRTVSLGASAFENCANLVSVAIPAGLTTMGAEEDTYFTVFAGCTALTSFTVDAQNPSYEAQQGVLYKKTARADGTYYLSDLLFCPQDMGGSVVIPNTVSKIWEKAFYQNNKVTEIKFSGALADTVDPETGAQKKGTLTIESNAFYMCSALQNVVLPEGLSVIGSGTFYECGALSSVTIPGSVTSIGSGAFYKCGVLSEVNFAEGDEEVGLRLEDGNEGVFNGCGALTHIELPKRLTYIGQAAFVSTGIVSIVIPANVETVGKIAFQNLKSLTSVTFEKDSKCTVISENAFYGTPNLREFVFPDHLDTIKGNAFRDSAIENVELPSTLKTIETYAFYGMRCATIELPEGLTKIANYAFSGSSLESVRIPSTLTTFGEGAFVSNSKLQSVVFAPNSQLKTLGKYAFNLCKALESVDFGTGCGITKIDESAFKDCVLLSSVTIPASVETIAKYAFQGCKNLSAVNFEEGSHLKDIGSSTTDATKVFADTKLTQFVFPESTNVIKISPAMFSGVTTLKSIHLSTKVQDISGMLNGCGSVEYFTVAEGSEYFSVDKELPILYNAEGKSIRFVFGDIESTYRIPDGALEIGASAFFRNPSIEKIIIPRTVQKIGTNAFADCINLKEIFFEEESLLEEIGDGAFWSCFNLTQMNLEECTRLQTLGKGVFERCGLENADLSKSKLTSLPASGYTFYYCQNLKSVKFPATITNLGSHNFLSCSVESVDLEAATQLTALPNQYFNNCTKLTEVKLPSSITNLGQQTFMGCTSLTSIDLSQLTGLKALTNNGGTSVTTESSTFNGCTSLQRVVLPVSCTVIGKQAFVDCPSLTEINLENVKTFGANVFQNAGLTSFTFRNGVTYGNYLLSGCADLTHVNFADGFNSQISATYLFQNCKSLTSIELPAHLTKIPDNFLQGSGIREIDLSGLTQISAIGNYMFSNCADLTRVILPAKSLTFGNNAFQGCASLNENGIDISRITKFGNNCFAGSGFTSFEFKKGVSYGTNLFDGCEQLANVTFDSAFNGTSLPNTLFRNCKNLKTITLPASLNYLGTSSFQGSGLTEINLSPLTNLTCIGTGPSTCTATSAASTFADCLDLVSVTLPSGCTKLAASVFKNCENLSVINLTRVTLIGKECFYGTKVASLNSSALTELGESAFANSEITSFTAPQLTIVPKSAFSDSKLATFSAGQLTEIGNLAFARTNLTSISLPATLKTLKEDSFLGTALTKIESAGTTFTVSASGFLLDNSAAKTPGKLAYVPAGVKTDSDGVLTLDPEITVINKYAFAGTDIKKLVVPATVTTINGYAFAESNLEEITFLNAAPLNSTSATYLFYNCKQLQKVVLPEGVTKIGNYWFAYSGITSFEIPEDVVEIGTKAFQGSALAEITIPEQITKVGDGAFQDCADLETANIYGALAASVSGAKEQFLNDVKLSKVTFGDNVSYLTTSLFQNTPMLEAITLPANLLGIGSYAFQESGIRKLVVPESVTELGTNDPFLNCVNLVSLSLPALTVGSSLLKGCTSLTDLRLAPGITVKGSLGGFLQNCTALKHVWIPAGFSVLTSNTNFGGWGEDQTIYFEESERAVYGAVKIASSHSTSANAAFADIISGTLAPQKKFGYSYEAYLAEIEELGL